MGIDWHAAIVYKDRILAETDDLFDGRDSEWFANLRGEGWDNTYDSFPTEYGWDAAPEQLKEKYGEDWCFDFRQIKIVDFINWFESHAPNLHAGWVTKYDAWLFRKKGVYLNPDNIKHYLDKDDIIEDYEWIEYVDQYDHTYTLYKFIKDYDIPEEAYLLFCFDW